MRDALLAISMLTIVPTGARWPDDRRPHVADYLVVPGALLGLACAVVGGAMAIALPFASWLVGVGVVTLSAVLTRGFHWDGLADVADAWTVEPQRQREVLKDSRTGAFGVLAIVCVFVLQSASYAALCRDPRVLAAAALIALTWGRLAASMGAWHGTPLSEKGLAASIAGRPSAGGAVVCAVVLAGVTVAASWLTPIVALTATVTGLFAALIVPWSISRRFGGINGDVLGASVLLVETAALFTAVFAMTVTDPMWLDVLQTQLSAVMR